MFRLTTMTCLYEQQISKDARDGGRIKKDNEGNPSWPRLLNHPVAAAAARAFHQNTPKTPKRRWKCTKRGTRRMGENK